MQVHLRNHQSALHLWSAWVVIPHHTALPWESPHLSEHDHDPGYRGERGSSSALQDTRLTPWNRCADTHGRDTVTSRHRANSGPWGPWLRRGWGRLWGRRWWGTAGHPMAFGIHTLHIGHIIAPLQRRR
jgi:hypothetical protein